MAMSNSLGVDADIGKTMALNLTGLVGDIASFYNITTEQANTAISAIYTGETESIKKLGIVLTEANLNAYAVSQGLKKTYNQMTQAEKVMLRYNYVMKASANIQGDFARTSGNWANQVRILKEQFSQLLSILGRGLIAVLNPVVKVMNNLLASLIAVANAMAKAFGGKGIESASGKVSSSVGDIADGAGDIGSGFDDANDSAKALAKTVAGFDELNVLNSPKGAGSGDTGLGGDITGSGEVVEGPEMENPAGKLSDYLQQCKDIIDKWVSTIPKLEINFDKDKAIDDLKNIGLNILNTIMGWGTFVVSLGIEVANDLDIGALANSFLNLVESATKLTSAITESLTPALQTFYQDSGLKELVQWIGEKFKDGLDGLAVKLDEWAEWFKTHKEDIKDFASRLGEAVNPIAQLVIDIGDDAWTIFTGLLERMNTALYGIANSLLGLSVEQLRALVTAIITIGSISTLGSLISPLFSFIAGLEIATIKAGKGTSTFKAFFEALNLKAGLKAFGTDWADTFTNGVKSIIKDLDKMVLIIPNAFKTAFSSIKGFFLQYCDPDVLFAGTKWQQLGNIFINMLNPVKEAIKTFFLGIGPNLQASFLQVKAVFTNLGIMIAEKGVLGTAITGLKTLLGNLGGAFKALWAVAKAHPFVAVITVITAVVTSIISLYNRSEEFRNLLSEIWENTIKPVFEGVRDTFTDLYNNHLKPLMDKIFKGDNSLVGQIKPIIKKIWDFLTTFIAWVSANILPVFITVFGSVLQTIGEVVADIIDFIGGLIDTFSGIIQFLTGVFTGDWTKAWEGIKKAFKGIFDSLVAVAKAPLNLIIGLINGMLNAIGSGINGVVRAVKKLSFTVPDWVPGIGGEQFGFGFLKTVTVPQIPYLANGGIITEPTVAMMGEYAGAYQNPEIVAPQNLLQQVIENSNNNVVDALIQQTRQLLSALENIDLDVSIGDEQIAKSAQRGNLAYKRRTGKPLFA